jgi:hypothetical protein
MKIDNPHEVVIFMGYGVGGVGFSCAGYGGGAAFFLILFILLVIILAGSAII